MRSRLGSARISQALRQLRDPRIIKAFRLFALLFFLFILPINQYIFLLTLIYKQYAKGSLSSASTNSARQPSFLV